jgi:atypical dual specificity phosphatase
MHEVYWVDKGRVAGRCGPWRAPFDLEAMEAAGIGTILSLDAREAAMIPDGGDGIARKVIHLPDSIPPGPSEREIFRCLVPEALDFLLTRSSEDHKAVLVHCHAGKDRTGTVLAAYVMKTRKVPPRDALAAVRTQNPDAVTSLGYEDMALEILQEIAARG